MDALATDLYQFTMLDAYLAEGLEAPATFELYVRRLPAAALRHVPPGNVLMLPWKDGDESVPIDRFVHCPGAPQVPRLIREMALEVMGNHTPAQDAAVEQLALDFAKHCSDVQAQLRSMEAESPPSVVVCRASRRARKVANALSTLCGWSWSADPRATLPIGTEWEGGWRRRCIIYADRLLGGASSTHGVHEASPVPSR
jgi:hypothetical protein